MERIIQISYNENLSHIGSCLTTYPIIEHIYKTKNDDDKIVLSSGHAGLALYVALEKYENKDPIHLLHKYGIHPERDVENGIHVSSGSLGSAVLIATGMAFANRKRDVYCIISDGECAEGSVWEALRFAYTNKLTNLKIHVNMNGYCAYDEIDTDYLVKRLRAFYPDVFIWKTKCPETENMSGLLAHYYVLKLKDKNDLLNNAQTICELVT